MAHRIDHSTATGDSKFTEGDPGVPTPATVVTDDWLNDTVQEEICQAVERAGIVLDKASNDQLADAIPILAAPHGPRNNLINGNMRYWQRGTSFTLTADGAKYTADRWQMQVDAFASGTVVVSRQAIAIDEWSLDGETPKARWALRVDNSGGHTASGASNDFGVQQKIEDVRTLSNGKATLSLKVRANKAMTLKAGIVQNFGTGGSPSAQVWNVQDVSIGTTWAKVSLTFDVASIAGKTLGTNPGANNLAVYLYSVDTSGVWFDLAEVQLEHGQVATPWFDRPDHEEFALCQRYYEKSYDVGDPPGSITEDGAIFGHEPGGGSLDMAQVRFAVPKRVQPTVTWYSPTTGTANRVRDTLANADVAITNLLGSGQTSTGRPSAAGITADPHYRVHFVAEAEL